MTVFVFHTVTFIVTVRTYNAQTVGFRQQDNVPAAFGSTNNTSTFETLKDKKNRKVYTCTNASKCLMPYLMTRNESLPAASVTGSSQLPLHPAAQSQQPAPAAACLSPSAHNFPGQPATDHLHAGAHLGQKALHPSRYFLPRLSWACAILSGRWVGLDQLPGTSKRQR